MLTENEIIERIGRSTPLGLAIVFFSNVICFIIGSYMVKAQSPISSVSILTIILGIVGLADIGAAFVVKRNLLKPLFESNISIDNNLLPSIFRKITITISAICAAPPIYGLVAVFMGAQKEHLAAFLIISLAGYLALRLRPRDFEKLIDRSA
jgi:hypothetical protein